MVSSSVLSSSVWSAESTVLAPYQNPSLEKYKICAIAEKTTLLQVNFIFKYNYSKYVAAITD